MILTLSKNNPIESAKEARFKEDVRTFQDELALYISKQYANAGGHWDGSISATTYDEIINYIPSFTKKYEGKFVIENNNLKYTIKIDEKEKEYAQSLNITKRESILPDEFQQVEYIESTGTQYIDTKIYTDIDKKSEYTLTFKAINSNGWTGVNGSMQLNIVGNVDKKIYCVKYDGMNGIEEIYIDSNKIEERNWGKGNYLGNIFIGKFSNPFHFSGVSGYIYNSNIFDNNKLVRDFIPCYSTTTVTDINGKECQKGTVGMYDTVEGKFYTNQGIGEFIKGPDV